MPTSWTIGCRPDSDLVVDLPTVSGAHCRLTREGDDFFLEDLQSTNGTYLNGSRVAGRVRVSRADRITLGQTIPMPWPPEAPSSPRGATRVETPGFPTLTFRGGSMVVGRNPECDQVYDLPMVSGRHARLERTAEGVRIQDLGSSNGTFVNGKRIDRPVVVHAGDLIGFGSYTLVLAEEATARPAKTAVTTSTPPTLPDAPGLPSPSWSTHVTDEFTRTWRQPARLLALLGQAPLIALAIVLFFRPGAAAPATAEGWAAASRTIAAILSWLGLAAIWFGLSDGILGDRPEAVRAGPEKVRGAGVARWLGRFGGLGVLCLVQCGLAWAIVAIGSGLKAPAPSALAVLIVASLAGLALGLAAVSLAPRPEYVYAFLPAAMLAFWFLGGQQQPLPAMASWARVASGATPSRWAFEGLLLLEAERRPTPPAEDPAGDRDIAEAFFPAETERMGVGADALALAALAVGLAASAAFIAEGP